MITPDALILNRLHRQAGEFVAAELLERTADGQGVNLPQRITGLRRVGYDIDFHPHHGYRLVDTPDRLTADGVRALFEPRVVGREILVFEETGSTNDVVARLARTHPTEGLVVFAESQTRGRGRQGRAWESPRGKGLWFSVLLRPKFPLTRLTVAASVAVARVAGKAAQIKWPNDVTREGRKLAGILTEARDGAAALGIGVNVNCQAEDFPPALRDVTTSIATDDRLALAAQLLAELDELYRLAADDFATISAEWARRCTTLGKQIVIRLGERRIEGHAQALDEDGALLLRRDSGRIERIVGADLTLERE